MTTINDARIRKVNAEPLRPRGQYVLYWCQMYRRLQRNHALDYAIHLAKTLKKPLVIYEGLKLNPPWANARFHTFILEGMKESAAAAKDLGASYWPFVETPAEPGRGLVRKLAEKACAVVTDDYPAYIVPAQIRAIANLDVGVFAIDSNCVVPLSLLGKQVSAAAYLRPRIHKLFADCWPHRANAEPSVAKQPIIDAPFPVWNSAEDVTELVRSLPIDQSVTPLALHGGVANGKKQLNNFIRHKLSHYAEERNIPDNPDDNAASGLSPWLHYGHISIEAVIEQTLGAEWTTEEINHKTRNKDDFFCRDANINAFLDEAITWRDVGFQWHTGRVRVGYSNMSTHTADEHFNFDTMDFSQRSRGTLESVLPSWALKSLQDHAHDRREHLYSLEEFENADTHDELWNAAQTELVKTGKIHNYLRMLWGKKVLEWSASPEEAYDILETLNNKYAIDGRDPNSYTGILWCFGLFDRPWPGDRQVFGSVRFMSSDNTAKKFKLKGYHDYIARLRGERLF